MHNPEAFMKPHCLAALAAISSVMSMALALPALGRPLLRFFAADGRDGTAGFAGEARILAVAAPAQGEYTLGSLRIKAPWMRATPKGAKVAGGYLTVTNQGDKPDSLLSLE